MTVYAFDFDSTLTTKDTLIEFIRYVRGTRRLVLGLLLFSPILVLMKLHLYPNWKAKQQVFSWFFKGMTIDEFNGWCQRFAHDNIALLRPQAVAKIQRILKEEPLAKIVVVSASIDNWVKPFFDAFGDKILIEGTRIDVRDDRVTGKFLTMNCYGSEKVKRISRLFPHRKAYTLVAFGDSRGDKAMLDYADRRYYKPFRQ